MKPANRRAESRSINIPAAVNPRRKYAQDARSSRRVEGATVGGETYSDELREAFLTHVDPLIQREAVKAIVDFVAGGLLD